MNARAAHVDAMIDLGRDAAATAQAGSIFCLVGDLGAGKTHWTKGLVDGLGSASDVTSPTFSLVQEYRGGRLPVFHFDLYRVESADALLAIGWDEYLDAGGVVVLEWADRFPELIPGDATWLRFRIAEDGSREIFS